MDIVGLIVGAILTLLIFSFLLGDNALYRWALALIVGAAVGYAAAMAVRFVAQGWVARASVNDQGTTTSLTTMAPLLLGCLLLFKGFTSSRLLGRLSIVGNIPLGYLVGAGAAVSVTGALMGTIFPLALTTGNGVRIERGLLGLLQGVVILLTTIVTLLAFSTHARKRAEADVRQKASDRAGWRRALRQAGEAFVAVALGTAFAGAISSALTALVMRLWQLAALLDSVMNLTRR
ncbi:MAG: hypothetical protein MUF84_06045 [Anaerolineae bacterium]|jgi:hypothetical protein|nr:hypothetical protein [Anaerolineae bacterium]